jgi:hypothetical protein
MILSSDCWAADFVCASVREIPAINAKKQMPAIIAMPTAAFITPVPINVFNLMFVSPLSSIVPDHKIDGSFWIHARVALFACANKRAANTLHFELYHHPG